MKLQGKVALVTGASEGIGRALIDELTAHGVRCIAVSRESESKPHASEMVVSKNCDVGKTEAVTSLLQWIEAEYKELDIVVNNAGLWQKLGPVESIDDSTIEQVVQTNLLGPIYVTKSTLPLLRKASEAALVNIVSKSGVVAQAGQSVYTATKFGLRGFTDVLREDLKESSIHVMAVYQAGTNTQMFSKVGDTPPLEKFTEPADLAEYIVGVLAGPPKFWVKELHVDYK
ncbi:SDR family oxidoreductase [Candidatus Saccharibacteria bacterium]|nr:SDR family oxidoreductase [Candidatus Saccharibacteria bacterium]